MNHPRRIYLLDPKKLSPETIAVAFAKTSRSPKSFDEIAAELSDESSANFHEKWVVGYGHSSVAEHAVLHVAVENISRLVIECLESNRLASYTEKSSRYQVWDEDSFYTPDAIIGSSVENEYIQTSRMLFKEYQAAFTVVTKHLKENFARKGGESERKYISRIRSICADVCRYFLPTNALANVGISINARSLEHAIRKMLSHPLEEVRKVGEEIKKVSVETVPTLVKYADTNNYLSEIGSLVKEQINSFQVTKKSANSWCDCVSFSEQGENEILAALLYRFGSFSYQDAYKYISSLSFSKRKTLVNILLGTLENHDIPLREMEYADITFDLTIDQGAYFELKRHRMMSQTVRPFTPYLGYAIPRLINDAGDASRFTSAMEAAASAYEQIVKVFPEAAPYVLPNAFNRRVLVKMNLRSVYHLIKLRCATNAHFAIRRSTQRMAEIIRENFPLFAQYFMSGNCETWNSIEKSFFTKIA